MSLCWSKVFAEELPDWLKKNIWDVERNLVDIFEGAVCLGSVQALSGLIEGSIDSKGRLQKLRFAQESDVVRSIA